MLILLKIAAILAFIILPLISRKKNRSDKTNSEVSGFVVDENGDIHNAGDDEKLSPPAHKK